MNIEKIVCPFDENALKSVKIYAVGWLSNEILDNKLKNLNTGGSQTVAHVRSGSTYKKGRIVNNTEN